MMHLVPRMPRDATEEHVMIKAVKFASIPVRDQDKALEFYTKKLGLKVVTDSLFDGKQRWIELAIPRAETKLVLWTGEGQDKMIGGFMNVAFCAEDVEATAKEMKAKGGAEEGGLGHGGDLQGCGRQPIRAVDAVAQLNQRPTALDWRRRLMAKAFGAAPIR
jgi:catechol 2,3-dioxygenase-like lactoylglutathione lyase family enzyme